MLLRGGTLRTLCLVESASHKKTNTAKFHVYEVLEAVKTLETENGCCQELREGKRGVVVHWVQSFGFVSWKSSRDPVQSKVHIINATVPFT